MTDEMKRAIAYKLLENHPGCHPEHSARMNDSHLCRFRGTDADGQKIEVLISVKTLSNKKGKKPCVGFYWQGHKNNYLRSLRNLTVDRDFFINNAEIGDSDVGWVPFCRENCNTGDDMYHQIVDSVDGREDWKYLFETLRDWAHLNLNCQESFYPQEVMPASVQGRQISWNPSILLRAVEIVNALDYVSFHELCERLKDEFGCFDENDLYCNLQNECKSSNNRIGEVDKEQASKALLQERVFYSMNWAHQEVGPQTIEEKLGRHLYQRILRNHWNNWGPRNKLDFNTINKNGFGWIIRCSGIGYHWDDFIAKYGLPVAEDKGSILAKRRLNADKEKDLTIKKLNKELLVSLCNSFLNQRLPVAVINSATKKILVKPKQKLTKSLLNHIAKCRDDIEIDDPDVLKNFQMIFQRFRLRLDTLTSSL